WLARTQEFLLAAGMDPKRLHFRQHLTNEMAHYAADCWDAEFHSDRYGWVECVGIADRGSYDLTQHAKHSGTDQPNPLTGQPIRRPNPEFARYVRAPAAPLVLTVHDWVPTKKFFPTLKQKAKAAEWLMASEAPYAKEAARHGISVADWHLRDDEWLLTEKVVKTEPAKDDLHLKNGAETLTVPAECYEIATKEVTVQGRKVVPCVIEPSFGVDRILYALWEHAHEAGEKNGEPYLRLRLSPKVAPVQVAVLPLTGKDGLPEKAEELDWTLRSAGFTTDRDESGNIGRRYARQDEIGTPLCVTVDNESLQDGAVTVRERDTGDQSRIPIAGLVAHLRKTLG
ncbi:MAG: His/Gly/Thr/Pro-type tRNA ligase C-terminal domain-containing protein, partial [Thermoplasmatota archaeon]